MLKVAIRADGGAGIGMGHVMRCLSLARVFKDNGHEVYFFSKLIDGIDVIESQGFSVVRLNNTVLENEVYDVIDLLKEYMIDILIVDSYKVNESYFISLRKNVDKLVYIDDENKIDIPANVVINGNLTAEYLGYSKYDTTQILLLGTEYNLIRDEFKDMPARIVKENVESVMITTGGSDNFSLTKKFLDMLLQADQFSNLRCNILVGSGFTNVDELIALSKIHTRIRLFSNQSVNIYTGIRYSSVVDLMLNSDVAISAGGSTLYELTACGTPTLAFILAENQRFLVEKMAELEYIVNLGWHDELNQKVFVDALCLLINDYKKRIAMSRKGKSLVDTRGAERIVRVLT